MTSLSRSGQLLGCHGVRLWRELSRTSNYVTTHCLPHTNRHALSTCSDDIKIESAENISSKHKLLQDVINPVNSAIADQGIENKKETELDISKSERTDPSRFGTYNEKLPRQIKRMKKKLNKKFENKESSFKASNRQDSVTDSILSEFSLINTERKEDWPEVFGTLGEDDLIQTKPDLDNMTFKDDEDESEEPYRPLAVEGRKHSQLWYGREIEKLLKKGQIYEAIEILETKMLKEDRVLPNSYVFTALIGGLGRVGYTKKAFSLFNKMKKYGLLPEDPTYTALFNACSNSPWKADGLQRAGKLRELMKEKDHKPNLITFKAMVKAYAVLGDMLTAFTLVDEIEAAGYRPDAECFSFLLMACISDADAGFKLAIEVWKRMRKRKITPTIYQYNLLLRALRDCGVGTPEFAQQLLQSTESPHPINPPPLVEGSHHLRTNVKTGLDLSGSRDGTSQPAINNVDTAMEAVRNDQCFQETEATSAESSDTIECYKHWWQHDIKQLTRSEKSNIVLNEPKSSGSLSILNMDIPNILNPRVGLQGLVHLQNLDQAEYRLGLLGGLPGILSHMQKDGVEPDIKTFSQLIEIVPSDVDTVNDLLSAMTAQGVKPNVDMLNMLIRKRNKERDFSGARDVLKLMAKLELEPNVRTFGCLAMGCPKKRDGLQLLDDMEAAGLLPNVEICNILIYQSGMDFSYKKAVCRTLTKLEIPPNENILQRIEYMIDKAKKETVRRERGETVVDFYLSDYFIKGFRDFMMFYKPWLLSMKVDRPEHAWSSFRRPTQDKQDIETDLSSF